MVRDEGIQIFKVNSVRLFYREIIPAEWLRKLSDHEL